MLFQKKNNYSEGISIGHVFVLTDDKGVAKNLPCWCKDYFQDYFWMIKTGKDFGSIHGFNHKIEKEAESYAYHIRFGSKNNTDKDGNYLYCTPPYRARLNIRDFLSSMAKDLKLSVPKVTLGKSTEGNVVISFNSDWYKYPYLHSLFTSAIRIGTYISYEDFVTREHNNLLTLDKFKVMDLGNSYNTVRAKYLNLLKNGLKDIKWENYTPGNIHSSSGIQSTTL